MSDDKKGERKATILIGTPAVMPRGESEWHGDSEPPSRNALAPDEPTHDSDPGGSDPGDSGPGDPEPSEPVASEPSDPEASDPEASDPEASDPEASESDPSRSSSDEPPASDPAPARESRVERPSLLMELRKSRTTIIELSTIADRLSRIQPERTAEPSIVKQMVLSFGISLTVVLLVAMIFVGGTWRIVLGIMGGTCGMTLAVFAGFRALPRVAQWLGPRELPGRAWMWLGGVALALASAAGALVWTLSEATASLAMIGVPDVKPPSAPASAAVSAVVPDEAPADATLPRDARVSLEDGVVYVPPSFASPNGRFDLIVHFHGNTDLVAQSVAASQINAIVYIINYGESSSVYARPFSNPDAFDRLLVGVERRVARMGLQRPRVERVALTSWSAGYGALYHILRSRSRLDRVDALLLMDSLHASYSPSGTGVDDASLAPFVSFAKRAIAGEKLMVLTHARIDTHGYASTQESADALLQRLELVREDVEPEQASPPEVELEVARSAFPAREQNWMQVVTAVHENNFHLLGCTGNDKPDHIAHLAQMSTSVLPHLAERWSATETPE